MVRQLTRSSPCSQPIIRAATPEQWLPLPPVTQEAVSATQRQWLPLPPRTRTSKGSRTRHLLSSPLFRPPFVYPHGHRCKSQDLRSHDTRRGATTPQRSLALLYGGEEDGLEPVFSGHPHELVSLSIPSRNLKLTASGCAGTLPFYLKEKGGSSS